MTAAIEPVVLAVFFLVYFSTAFAWPTWRVWRLTGTNPYVLPDSDDAYGLVTQSFRLILATIACYVTVQAVWPRVHVFLGQLTWLATPPVQIFAWLGLLTALCWTIVAQYQMGMSWRIGIDPDTAPPLVTVGLFRTSRNPIFLAMRFSLFCLMLLQPNALTMSIWLAADLLMQLQVRLEEDYLSIRHGAAYAQYRHAVRRWL